MSILALAAYVVAIVLACNWFCSFAIGIMAGNQPSVTASPGNAQVDTTQSNLAQASGN